MQPWARPETIRATLLFVMKVLKASGAEFLSARGETTSRVGVPRWRESARAQARRAEEEMGLFRRLDNVYSAWVRPGDTPHLDAWVLRLNREGLRCLNRRIGDHGVMHVFFRNDAQDATVPDNVLDGAAEHLEAILTPRGSAATSGGGAASNKRS